MYKFNCVRLGLALCQHHQQALFDLYFHYSLYFLREIFELCSCFLRSDAFLFVYFALGTKKEGMMGLLVASFFVLYIFFFCLA